MTKSHRFFDLLDIEYRDAILTIRVAELLEGEPDGYIGTPLVVKPSSEAFAICFKDVTEFRSRAEPCYTPDGKQRDITPFLCECLDSDYVRQVCPFGGGAKEPARHFAVYTESVVLEVLTSTEPQVSANHVA